MTGPTGYKAGVALFTDGNIMFHIFKTLLGNKHSHSILGCWISIYLFYTINNAMKTFRWNQSWISLLCMAGAHRSDSRFKWQNMHNTYNSQLYLTTSNLRYNWSVRYAGVVHWTGPITAHRYVWSVIHCCFICKSTVGDPSFNSTVNHLRCTTPQTNYQQKKTKLRICSKSY